MIKSFAAVLVATLACVTSVWAEEEQEKGFSLDTAVGFNSDYMFRGLNLYDGMSIQPSITPSYYLPHFGTLSGNVWSHISGESDRKDENFTEVDYSVRWDFELGPVGVALGHLWYTYPHDNTDSQVHTREYLVALTADLPLSPTLSFYNDYDSFDSQYYELGLSHEIETDVLGKGFAVTPFVAFGFASDAEATYNDNGLVQITGGLSFDLSVGDLGINPTLNYTYGIADNAVNEFWTALNFTFSI